MDFIDRTAVVVRPTRRLLAWLHQTEKAVNPIAPVLPEFEAIRQNPTVYLIPECATPEEAIAYIDEIYSDIFMAELASWFMEEALWPEDMSLKVFWEFFEVEVHDQVIDATSVDDNEDADF